MVLPMVRRRHLVLLLFFIGLLTVFPSAASVAQTLTSITVNPADPTITVGQSQPFTATGTFSDGSTRPLTPAATAIATGNGYTCALLSDGTVQCWGLNSSGQLGDGTTTDSTTPVAVNGLSTTATAITAGSDVYDVYTVKDHTCAVLSGGTVKCWGDNSYGQLGNGSSANSSLPVGVSGISTATAIAAGTGHTCVLLSNGTVTCWGWNQFGQLGNGTKINSSLPGMVSGISTATAIAAGGFHTCALLSGGTVTCWGLNESGQLGNGSITNSSLPVAVSGISTATTIAAGKAHACVVLSDGTAKCWGLNSSGQLGNYGTTSSSLPVSVSYISTATAITAGRSHTCAKLSNGTVQCWGWNSYGQLGNGSEGDSSISVTVSGLSTATTIAAGYGHTCALLSDGTVQCWGDNTYGQLGNGSRYMGAFTTPVAVSGITSATPARAIAADGDSCALMSDGTVRCWGVNTLGQLGNGTTTDSTTPVAVSGISTATAIDVGGSFACAVLSDGSVKCWGFNSYSQLGIGTSVGPENCGFSASYKDCSKTPMAVRGLSTARAIDSKAFHTCALLSDGTVACWGDNIDGQLGNGTTYGAAGPVMVSEITSATPAIAVAAGGFFSCALLSSGTVKCWGNNSYGQLGNGTSTGPEICGVSACSTTPVSVSGLSTATTIAAGDGHACALLADGTVKCWGDNSYGQLGNGTSTGPEICGSKACSTTPVSVSGITSANPATAITGGSSHACALMSDGTVKCWGWNSYGQLGNGTSAGPEICNSYYPCSTTPVSVSGLLTATSITAGGSQTCAVLSDGAAKCWGGSYFGQLGNGSSGYSALPVEVSGLSTTTSLVWSSSNTAVATIDAGGRATGLGAGTTTITATSEGISGSTSLTVNSVPLPDLILSVLSTPTTVAAPGGSFSLSNTVRNVGSASAGSFVIAFHLSGDRVYGGTDDVALSATQSVTSLAAGATSAASTTLAVPTTAPLGVYYICAFADSSTAVAEEDETNNANCTTSTIQVTRPDLLFTQLTINAATVNGGGTLPVSFAVGNQGGVSSNSATASFHLSANAIYGDADDVVLSPTASIPPIPPSYSGSVNLTVPGTITSGSYFLCAMVDSGNTNVELDETNNTRCSSSTVTVPPSDLTMTALSTATTTVAPGGSLSLSNTAQNVGGGVAGAFVIAFHLSTNPTYGDGDDIAVTATRSLPSLAAGASNAASTALTVPATTPPGSYYLCALADSGGSISEGNETNNSNCTSSTVQVASPDLVMTAVTPNAATVSTTATLSVTTTVKNQGAVSAGSFTVGYNLSPTASYDNPAAVAITTTRTVSSLAAGATNTATTTLAIPNTTPPNTYYVCAKADSANTVTELNESNNTLCSPGTVTVPSADLVMTAVSTVTAALAPGKTLALSNTVKNQGLFPAGSFVIGFHLSTNPTYGDGDDISLTATRSLTTLASGASSTASTTLTIPTTTPVGSYYLCAMADSGTTVNEGALESNNTLCTASPIQVTLPDLVITTISPNAASVNQGAYLSVTDTVHNQGLLPTSNSVRITYHLSVNATYGDADDVVIATYRTVSSGLAAGASNTATTSLAIPSTTPPNSYYVCALADSLSAVAETDETNNTRCSSAPVIVPPPDLIISAISTTATTVAKGANFTLSNTVKNQGGSKTGAFVIAFHLSTNTTYGDGDDVALTQSRSVTSLAIGATSAASTLLTVPATTPSGTYSVCALADSGSTVPEGDETNNSGCTTTTITVP